MKSNLTDTQAEIIANWLINDRNSDTNSCDELGDIIDGLQQAAFDAEQLKVSLEGGRGS